MQAALGSILSTTEGGVVICTYNLSIWERCREKRGGKERGEGREWDGRGEGRGRVGRDKDRNEFYKY